MAERYDYESLGADVFQQLCQALLVTYYPNVQCFPVGMPDGGRDAAVPSTRTADAVVYQVKFRKPTPNKLATADEIEKWAAAALEGEVEKVRELASRGAEQYVLLTNAQCSSHLDSGTRDRVQAWLDTNMPIPGQVWWRDDLDRRLDSNTEIKRTYGLIRDITGLAELLGLRESGADQNAFIKVALGDSRVSALMKYMTHQYERDKVVRFKQAELEPQLLDVYIDVPFAVGSMGRYYANSAVLIGRRYIRSASNRKAAAASEWAGLISPEVSSAFMTSNRQRGLPAASVLLADKMVHDDAPSNSRFVIEGAPGQGKSTVGQYVCQVHRSRLLGVGEIDRFLSEHRSSPIRLPFHVDFRDLATWLQRNDPFDVKNDGLPEGWAESLEAFLAAQVSRYSGGMNFSVSDLDAVLRSTPAIIVLDGLDEVPDLNDRRAVVACVNEALNRIEPFSPSFRTMITSRPSSFSKTPGFSKREYTYFTLGDLPLVLVLAYTDGWLKSRKVSASVAQEIRQVLGQKLGQPHIVDLARNPMQLAILLWLVRKKGPSLPDKRTALYSEYMETFLDREAEKSDIIRDERELILDLHGYVAWQLHCLAETGESHGSISEPKLKVLLKKYLQLRGYKKKKLDLVDELFTGMTDRVMVLTSRVQNTFEFEVQPLREYFAARYLYSTARTSTQGAERAGNRSDRFEALLRNPYWWNVTRFYAGFSDVGELANLVDLLEDLVNSGGDFSLISYSREVALTLLRDQVFSQKPRAVSKIVDLLSPEESVSLLGARDPSVLSIPADSGGEEIAERMMTRIEKRIALGVPDFEAAKLVAANFAISNIKDWWFGRFSHARTRRARRLWLTIAAVMDVQHELSSSEGSAVLDKMGDDMIFWHIILKVDRISQPWLAGSFDSFFAAFRAGVQLDDDMLDREVSAQGACVALTSFDYLSFIIQTNAIHSGFPFGIRDRNEMPGMEKYEALLRDLMDITSAITSAGKPRNNSSIWVDYHASLTSILGGQCRRTLALAVALGQVRSGNLSRSAVSGLFDEAVSPVLRARYARQRRADSDWWADQCGAVGCADDAFFVLCCMLSWAPASVLIDNASKLEKWVKGFDGYTLRIMRSMVPRAWQRGSSESDLTWPLQSSAGMLYLGSAKMRRRDAVSILASVEKKCRDQDLTGLIGAALLEALVSPTGQGWVENLPAIVDAYTVYQRDAAYISVYPRIGQITSSGSREVLCRASGLPTALRYLADDFLTAEVARKAANMADVSAKGEWFDRDALD